MSTESNQRTSLDPRVIDVEPEPVAQARFFTRDFRGRWQIIVGIAIIATLFLGVLFQSLIGFLVAIALAITEVALYWFLVHNPPPESGRPSRLARLYSVGRHRRRAKKGLSYYRNELMTHGQVVDEDSALPQLEPLGPPELGPVEWVGLEVPRRKNNSDAKDSDVEYESPLLGLAYDHRDDAVSFTFLQVEAGSSATDGAEQIGGARRSFAQLLDALNPAVTSVARIKWRVQTLPGEAFDPVEWRETVTHGRPYNPADLQRMEDYTRAKAEASTEPRTTYTVTINRAKLSRRERKRGSGGMERALIAAMDSFYARATHGSTPVFQEAVALTPEELVWENRLAIDPVFAVPEVRRRESGQFDDGGDTDEAPVFDPTVAFPVGGCNFEDIKYAWIGGTVHAYFLLILPRGGVDTERFYDVLRVKTQKSIVVIFEPLHPSRTIKDSQRVTTGQESTILSRMKDEKRVTKLDEVKHKQAESSEEEVAWDPEASRVLVYADVSGRNVDEVDDGIGLLRAACDRARIRMEPLEYDDLEVGAGASMPTGRGLDDIVQ